MSRESFAAFDEGMRALAAGPPQYGTSVHYPSCAVAGCSGCLPPVLEGEIVEPWLSGSLWGRALDAMTVDMLGFDLASGGREAVFAQVRDGIVRVHVPDVR